MTFIEHNGIAISLLQTHPIESQLKVFETIEAPVPFAAIVQHGAQIMALLFKLRLISLQMMTVTFPVIADIAIDNLIESFILTLPVSMKQLQGILEITGLQFPVQQLCG